MYELKSGHNDVILSVTIFNDKINTKLFVENYMEYFLVLQTMFEVAWQDFAADIAFLHDLDNNFSVHGKGISIHDYVMSNIKQVAARYGLKYELVV